MSVLLSVSVYVSLFVFVSVTVSVDPCNMVNNFSFHVDAQKSHVANVKCQMSNACVDPWDIGTTFVFMFTEYTIIEQVDHIQTQVEKS